jgi:hypothetical protein
MHILLCFLLTLTKLSNHSKTSYVVEALWKAIPLEALCLFMNVLARYDPKLQYETKELSVELLGLPEDFIMLGQIWNLDCFPSNWHKECGNGKQTWKWKR